MIRIGITYLYTISAYGYPPAWEDDLRALSDIKSMGFHYLEMEALGQQHAAQIFAHKDDFRKALSANDIHVHNFCAVDPELVSLDKDIRKTALERFVRTAQLGRELGTETLHLASYAPPVKYLNGRPYALGEKYAYSDKFLVRIPDDFSWNEVWNALVESCRACADIAPDLTILMEPRIGETICSADALLRVIMDVDRPNFKGNFDTGHFSAGRECVPLALKKLQGHFANIHISDNIPSSMDHITVGRGSIDWLEFFRLLGEMDYAGYLGIDLSASDTLRQDLLDSADFILKQARQAGLEIEI
jgi:sugar phosphate isomerase/epimerase